MSVSGTMAITRDTLYAGADAINAQRGTQTWGANWVFNASGVQNDILVIADEFKNLSTSGAFATDAELLAVSGAITSSGRFTAPVIVGNVVLAASGSTAIGTGNLPLASGFAYVQGLDGIPYKLIVMAGGIVSGVAA